VFIPSSTLSDVIFRQFLKIKSLVVVSSWLRSRDGKGLHGRFKPLVIPGPACNFPMAALIPPYHPINLECFRTSRSSNSLLYSTGLPARTHDLRARWVKGGEGSEGG